MLNTVKRDYELFLRNNPGIAQIYNPYYVGTSCERKPGQENEPLPPPPPPPSAQPQISPNQMQTPQQGVNGPIVAHHSQQPQPSQASTTSPQALNYVPGQPFIQGSVQPGADQVKKQYIYSITQCYKYTNAMYQSAYPNMGYYDPYYAYYYQQYNQK